MSEVDLVEWRRPFIVLTKADLVEDVGPFVRIAQLRSRFSCNLPAMSPAAAIEELRSLLIPGRLSFCLGSLGLANPHS